MLRTNSRAGFTLIEMMVVVVITGVVSTALYQMLIAGQKSYDHTKVMVDIQQNARVGLQALSDDLRQVSYGKDPTQPSIHYAGPESVTFVADILPEEPGAEVISYFLSGDGDPDTPNPDDDVLMRVVADTSGNVLVQSIQTYGVADDGLTFRWYNGSGLELDNPVPQPEQIGEIYIEITTSSAVTFNEEYREMTLSTTIYPRNLPLSPARSRPSTPACTGPLFPNCESATLDWATPTTNTDGTDLPLGDISHFNFYFGTDIDDLGLFTRLARTINEWTVTDLEPGITYYVGVTCVSRSGVESYPCTRDATLLSSAQPKIVENLNVVTTTGVTLNWDQVTEFTDDELITTPVAYKIYRSETEGFAPDEDNLVETVEWTTTFVDTNTEGVECGTYYYRVAADACGNEGTPSDEGEGSLPAPPACPEYVSAYTTESEGEIMVSWTPPATRMDGSALDPADITYYRVYVDSVPGNTTEYVDVPGENPYAEIDGLLTCTTYYVNVQAIDQCAHLGDFCPSEEFTIFTSAPCDPDAPSEPATLSALVNDSQVALEWPANSVDCDMQGYLIYYGHAPGEYTGTNAAEGASPIQVNAEDVTISDLCQFSLTGLPTCTDYYVAIKAFDQCVPYNESDEFSPEVSGQTGCSPCQIDANCILWAVDGAGDNQLNLELYTWSAGAQPLEELIPSWSSGALAKEVWFGRPLTKIWDYDGSAGNGPYEPAASGTTLNLDAVQVDTWTSSEDGEPLMLVFDSDVRDTPMTLEYRGDTGTCSSSGSGTEAVVVENFDDGDFNGWTDVSGNWFVSNGEVNQSFTGDKYLLIKDGVDLGTTTLEAKINTSGGSWHSAYIVFRYQNSSNYYLWGIRTDSNKVRTARISNGTFIQTGVYYATLNDNTWYTLRVVVEGDRIKGYFDCELVVDIQDSNIWNNGGVGLTTRKATGRWDDVRVFAGSVYP